MHRVPEAERREDLAEPERERRRDQHLGIEPLDGELRVFRARAFALDDVERLFDPELAEERQALGERWFRQEYMCSFEDVVDAVFSYDDIQAALSDDVKPLFAE